MLRGGNYKVKIHIVQKDDTLWKLAEQYGVNFEALKQANTQLSNPDMIMPGMKIKIPTGAVQAKQPHEHHGKEVKKPEAIMPQQQAPKAEIPKPMPKEMPKMEVPKVAPMMEAPKVAPMMEMPKKEAPQIDENRLRALIREAVAELLPSVLRSLLQHLKPEIINQIKIDLELSKTEINNYQSVKAELPPKKEMPMPYQPEKVKPIAEIPCPPYPPSHYQQMAGGYPMHSMNSVPIYEGVQNNPSMVYSNTYSHGVPQTYTDYSPDYQYGSPDYDSPQFGYSQIAPQATMGQTHSGYEEWMQGQSFNGQQQFPGAGVQQPFGGQQQPSVGVQQPFNGMQPYYGGQQYANNWWTQPFQRSANDAVQPEVKPYTPVARQTIEEQHQNQAPFSQSTGGQSSATRAVDIREAQIDLQPQEEQQQPTERVNTAVNHSKSKSSAKNRAAGKRPRKS